ncbi:MAG: protein GumC [Desulfobacterium sp.]|nr:protein GumC [Desulfobacterium sp.]
MELRKINITPEAILDIVLRRRWILLVPLSIALMVGIYLSLTLPRTYEAKTLILIEPQRVPENYVRNIVNSDPSDRINSISQLIMSRTSLEQIIKQYDLFTKPEEQRMYLEDKIEGLRKRIDVGITRAGRSGADAFSISFRSAEPEKAMRIANQLATYFIDENLKVRESQALGTSKFIESELQTKKADLAKIEEALTQYKTGYMGGLPEQLNTNLSILKNLRDELIEKEKAIRDIKNNLSTMQQQQAMMNQQMSSSSMDLFGGDDLSMDDSSSEIDQLKAKIEELKIKYKEKHPDIQALLEQIARLEAKQAAEKSSEEPMEVPETSTQDVFGMGGDQLFAMQSGELRNELLQKELEIKNLQAKAEYYSKLIDDTPKREQELLTLNRDYSNIKASYESLLNRKIEADIAVNMERQQKGEQFRIIDPAVIPEKPISPNMKILSLLVIAIGLGIGGGITVSLELLNTSFQSPEEVEASLGLKVLTSIPEIKNAKIIYRDRVNNLASMAYSAFVLGLFAAYGIIGSKGPDAIAAAIRKIIS